MAWHVCVRVYGPPPASWRARRPGCWPASRTCSSPPPAPPHSFGSCRDVGVSHMTRGRCCCSVAGPPKTTHRVEVVLGLLVPEAKDGADGGGQYHALDRGWRWGFGTEQGRVRVGRVGSKSTNNDGPAGRRGRYHSRALPMESNTFLVPSTAGAITALYGSSGSSSGTGDAVCTTCVAPGHRRLVLRVDQSINYTSIDQSIKGLPCLLTANAPLMTSSNEPGTSKSALWKVRRSSAPGKARRKASFLALFGSRTVARTRKPNVCVSVGGVVRGKVSKKGRHGWCAVAMDRLWARTYPGPGAP